MFIFEIVIFVKKWTFTLSMDKEKLIAIGLLQAIFYTAIWMIDDYIGLILSSSLALVAFSVLVISWIADRLEYAGVAWWYYPLITLSLFIPLIIALIFWFFKSGEMDWMKPIF